MMCSIEVGLAMTITRPMSRLARSAGNERVAAALVVGERLPADEHENVGARYVALGPGAGVGYVHAPAQNDLLVLTQNDFNAEEGVETSEALRLIRAMCCRPSC